MRSPATLWICHFKAYCKPTYRDTPLEIQRIQCVRGDLIPLLQIELFQDKAADVGSLASQDRKDSTGTVAL